MEMVFPSILYSPDPGQTLTVTGQFANIGTWENEDNIDCALYMNGQELTRVRFEDLEPLSPAEKGVLQP